LKWQYLPPLSSQQDDHIDWLVEHEEFEKALELAKSKERGRIIYKDTEPYMSAFL
jgi:hypothetical protein